MDDEGDKQLRNRLVWALFGLAVVLIVAGTVFWLMGHKQLGGALFALAGADLLVWPGRAVLRLIDKRRRPGS